MFPNDAAAICPPKMRLTIGMDTPLRHRDLHQKSRSGSNQYKFLDVRVLRFRELGQPHPLAKARDDRVDREEQ